MSRDFGRKDYYNRDGDRDRDWRRNDYRYEKDRPLSRKRSRSPTRELEKRASRSPRKSDKDMLDENILSEISKLPEPSELWDNQMQESGFAAPPPISAFPTEGTYPGNYQPPYSGPYDDFPPVASMPVAQPPPDMSSWNQMSLPPPPAPAVVYNVEDQIKKEAAIETEMRHQKAALSKQREDYIKKTSILKKELDTLKDQRNELRGDAKRSPSPDTKRFLKENTKLQLEIQNKLKTINNVVDMLNGIIGEQAPEIVDTDDTPERTSKRKSRSPLGKKFNYVYYDPEMHWCRVCNEFPPTAKDYLNHLHSPAHHKMATQHMEAPWHSVTGVNEGFPSYPSAPTKRTPIRGLQFFVPSTAWYCKLCDQFIGDLHCASAHLKSLTHSKNYTNFVEQNPHWETDWMSDRQKAFEKARAGSKGKLEEKPQYTAHTITFSKDGFHTKRKIESPPPPVESKKKKEKKKKNKRKKSSSSSSSSSSSASDSEPKKKKNKKNKSTEKLTEWMSSIQMDRLNDSDRKLLDNIKTRIQKDKDADKRRDDGKVIDLCGPTSRDRRKSRSRERESRARDSRDSRARDRSSRDRDRNSRARDRNSRARDRESRSRDDRDKREGSRRRDDRDKRADSRRRDDRRDEDRRSPRRSPSRTSDFKKVDIRKMPFIGKMPVYKTLGKNTKVEETKKEDDKKKEDEDTKKRQEIDAEIQKKVAEFKEKIAKAQLERQQAELPPPLLLPLPHPFLPPAPAPAPPPPAPPVSTPQPPASLPKDFQDALDIIFPSEVNTDMNQQDIFSGIPGLGGGFPGIPGLGGVMNPFPQISILGQPPPHMMMGFDMNASLFGPRPQLYDTHVPMVPKSRQNKNKHNGPDKRIQYNKNNANRNMANKNNARNNLYKNNNHFNKNNAANKTTQNTNAANKTTAPNVNTANKTAPNTNTTTPATTNTPATNEAPKPPQPTVTVAAAAAAPTSTPAATATTIAAPTITPAPTTAVTTKNKEELDDLAMLGIDASDVGAGI